MKNRSPLRLANRYCLFAILAGLCYCSNAQAQVTAESLLKSSVEQIGPQHRDVADAIDQFKKGAFVECRKKLESARQQDPKIPPAGVMFAQLLFAANQPNLARAELERVVKSEPQDPEAFLLIGETAFQQRRYSEAQLAFDQAARLIKDYSANNYRKNNLIRRAYSGMAGVAEARENWADAARYLEPLVKQNPKDISSTTRLAQVLFKQDQKLGDGEGQEKEAYQKLIAIWQGDSANVRRPEITMGTMYHQAGNKSLAAKLMTKASTEDKQGLETQLTVARWALETGDMNLAEACSKRAAQIAPNSIQAKLIAGLTARYQKDLPAARSALESAHLQAPSNLAAILQLAVVLVEGTDQDKKAALEYSQIASRVFPDVSTSQGRESAVTSAWVLYRLGRENEAQRILQRAITGGSVSAESSYYAARIISKNNAAYAKQLLQAALKNDGVFPARAEAQQLLKSLGG